jgi:hypothetical protein
MLTPSDRTLAKGKAYRLEKSLEKYVENLRDFAKDKCQAAGNSSSFCNNEDNWEKYTYSKMVKMVFIPGEMSVDAKQVWDNPDAYNHMISEMNNGVFDEEDIVDHIDNIGNNEFKEKQVYLFLIHGKAHAQLINHFKTKIIPHFNRNGYTAKLIQVNNLQSFTTDYIQNVFMPEIFSYTTKPQDEDDFYNVIL